MNQSGATDQSLDKSLNNGKLSSKTDIKLSLDDSMDSSILTNRIKSNSIQSQKYGMDNSTTRSESNCSGFRVQLTLEQEIMASVNLKKQQKFNKFKEQLENIML